MKLIKCLVTLLLLLVGCSQTNPSNDKAKYPIIEQSEEVKIPTQEDIKIPESPGILVMENDLVSIDYSNSNLGYIMVKTLKDDHKRIKVQIIKDDETYNYDLSKDNEYISYPLNMGDGKYDIQVRESVKDNTYAFVLGQEIDVKLDDPNYPYLYPNQIIDYDLQTAAISKSFELCEGATTELERVYRIYTWIVENIDYDWDKVEEVQNKFVVPIIDETLEIKSGICFDYAALMTCMLRVQQIPTKLITGYVEEGYHAWVEVYIHDVGWVDPNIYFNSEEWKLMDPTFAAAEQNYKGSYESKYNY
ncbi:transglutaminase domain-containing protein [Anaerorhabdus furcosa]|uniref:Transglutaminase-like superfamily protein n=1 Tax=Anaerorhabdus furcosa TaxID=118967 RepID=A0A1T4JYM4_9FIRM|nr:transglutaminase-like domain-containing protein [Anaerorhabdus furcosa]SJZ35362.1 Transglutaminase-like superfamily protein [Anaerorhabdus furcosa]